MKIYSVYLPVTEVLMYVIYLKLVNNSLENLIYNHDSENNLR